MSWRVQTKDGALGKSMKTTAAKRDDTEITICEVKAQMFVPRESIDDLCGRPRGWSNHFYDELGAPVEAMSLLLIHRELEANGSFSRGEVPHQAQFVIKNAIASSIRFRIDNHGAVMICALTWTAAGDEVAEAEALLGRAVAVNMLYAESKQQKLGLTSAAVVADEKQRQKKKGKKKGRKRKGGGEEQLSIPDGEPAPPDTSRDPELDDERGPDDDGDLESGAETRH